MSGLRFIYQFGTCFGLASTGWLVTRNERVVFWILAVLIPIQMLGMLLAHLERRRVLLERLEG